MQANLYVQSFSDISYIPIHISNNILFVILFKLGLNRLHIIETVMPLNKADKHNPVINLRENFDYKFYFSQVTILIGS